MPQLGQNFSPCSSFPQFMQNDITVPPSDDWCVLSGWRETRNVVWFWL